MGEHEAHNIIEEAYDPPAYGGKDDRVPRVESYVKDFKPFNLGTIALEAGKGSLVLKTLTKPGNQSIDLRLITLTRIENEETL